MTPHEDTALTVIRAGERDPGSLDYRRVRRAIETDAVTRIARGSYVTSAAWSALTPREQHRHRVLEAMARARSTLVLSHFAAAAVWGLDVLGAWPNEVDVRVDRSRGGRSTGLLRRHVMGVDDAEIVDWEGHLITSPAQTAMDLAAVLPFTLGVVVLDQALWTRRPGGALASRHELETVRENESIRRGVVKLHRALEFATELSDSVRESHSRVLLHRLGFPAPVLQHPIRLADGTTIRSDFLWPEFDHAGEFDGTGKYLEPALLAGRTPEQALIAEKDRGDALRRVVSRVSRWRTPALHTPRILFDILTADGLPSSRRRPSLAFPAW